MAMIDFSQDTLTVAREMLDRFNRRDYAGIIEAGGGTVDYTEIGTGRHITDPEELTAALEAWVTGLPDIRGTVTSAMRDGDRLCMEIAWEGTHTGDLVTPAGTLPASGNVVRTRGVQISTVSDGRIVSTNNYVDVMSMLNQMTAVPAQSPAAAQSGSVST